MTNIWQPKFWFLMPCNIGLHTVTNSERIVAGRQTTCKQLFAKIILIFLLLSLITSLCSSRPMPDGLSRHRCQRRVVDTAVELAERRKCSSTHPDDQVLVLVTVVGLVVHIQLKDGTMPVGWRHSTAESI